MIPDPAELVRLAGEHAERILIKERYKDLTATYLLFSPDGNGDGLSVEIVACPWHNDIEKQLMLLAVKKRARESGAVALSFVTEAWVARRSRDKPQWDLPPSQDPQRREVVFAAATDGKTKASREWQIVRDKPGGRIVSLIDDGEITDFEGRVIDGILP